MSIVSDIAKSAKLPAKQAGGNTVAKFFEANKPAMAAVLPQHVSPDRMLKVALGALRTNPQLMECSTQSLFGAVVQCAQLGLEPNTPLGHAYLVPFRNKKAGRQDVQVIPGYRGLIDMARRSGQITSLSAHAVYAADEFEFEYGLHETLRHVPARVARGEIIGFYAIAQLKGGGHQFEVMWDDDVRQIMFKTQSGGRWGPWKDHYAEMGRKTVVRRLFKYLPVSIEIATAVALDGMAERGESQDLSGVLDGDFAVVDDAYVATVAAAERQAADEWPKQDGGGWVDSRGIRFDDRVHATSDHRPTVNQDGSFRKRRRCNADLYARIENGEPHDRGDDDGNSDDGDNQPAAILAKIHASQSISDLESIETLLLGWAGTEGDLLQIEDAITEARLRFEQDAI